MSQHTLHLSYDQFTKLPRFLQAPENKGHAFGAIAKPYVTLHAENMSLASPVSFFGTPVAGEIEDTFTNLVYASERFQRIVDNLGRIHSLELFHGTQAVDLRERMEPKTKLSPELQKLHDEYRKVVPFVSEDRVFTPDIENGAVFIRNYELK